MATRNTNGLGDLSPDKHSPSPQSLKGEVLNVSRHSLVYLVGPAVSKLVGFVLIPIYTRYIAPSEYGVHSLVDVMMTMVMMVLSMGAADAMTRFYYEEPKSALRRRLVATVLVGPALISLPIVVLAITLAGILRPWLGIGEEYVNYLRLALLTAWFSMFAEIGYAYLRMLYYSRVFVAITVAQILAAVTLNLLLVVGMRMGIWGILISTLVTQGAIGFGLALGILGHLRARPSWTDLRRLLQFGLPLVPSTVTLQLSNYLNPLLIRWFVAGDPVFVLAQVGIYSAGQKLAVLVNRFVTVPFNSFWRPRRMELVVQDSPSVRRILARMCTYATLITVQIALLLSTTVESLLRLVLDERYWQAHIVVPIIALSYVILGLEHHFGTGMHYSRRTAAATWIGLVALLAMILVNVACLPWMGMIAAAIATLVAVSLRSTLFLAVSQRLYPIPFELGRLTTVMFTAVALFLISRLIVVESMWLNLLLQMIVALLLIPVLWLLPFFDADERHVVRSELSRRWLLLRNRRAAAEPLSGPRV